MEAAVGRVVDGGGHRAVLLGAGSAGAAGGRFLDDTHPGTPPASKDSLPEVRRPQGGRGATAAGPLGSGGLRAQALARTARWSATLRCRPSSTDRPRPGGGPARVTATGPSPGSAGSPPCFRRWTRRRALGVLRLGAAVSRRGVGDRRHGTRARRSPRGPGGSRGGDQEAGDRADEDDDRGPVVEPQAEDVVGVVDPQALDPEAADGVGGDVEREGPAVAEAEAAVGPEHEQRRRRRPTATRTGTSGGTARCPGWPPGGARGRSSGPRAAWSGRRTAPG